MAQDLIDVDAIKKKLDEGIKEVARQVASEIAADYDTAINAFYASYSPRRYSRTGASYQGSSGYQKTGDELTVRHGEMNYSAGIKVGAEFINGEPYKTKRANGKPYADKKWVFTNTFEKGLHGYGKNIGKKLGTFATHKESGWQRYANVIFGVGTRYKIYTDSYLKRGRSEKYKDAPGATFPGSGIDPVTGATGGAVPHKLMNRFFKQRCKEIGSKLESVLVGLF